MPGFGIAHAWVSNQTFCSWLALHKGQETSLMALALRHLKGEGPGLVSPSVDHWCVLNKHIVSISILNSLKSNNMKEKYRCSCQ